MKKTELYEYIFIKADKMLPDIQSDFNSGNETVFGADQSNGIGVLDK